VQDDYNNAAIGSSVRLLNRRIRQGRNLFNISLGATENADVSVSPQQGARA
jgi:hypothetical protein